MKRKIQLIIVIVSAIVTFQACSKDSEDQQQQQPPGTCNTQDMKYTVNIVPILTANCFECHGNGTATSGVNLETYSSVKSLADNGKLVGVVSHAAGFKQMPYNKPKLSDCDINRIKSWVAAGALNN